MGTVTPQNITLSNMNVVGADEIRVEENGIVSKAFLYMHKQNNIIMFVPLQEKRKLHGCTYFRNFRGRYRQLNKKPVIYLWTLSKKGGIMFEDRLGDRKT